MVLLLAALFVAAPSNADDFACTDKDPGVHPITLTVNGQEATGHYALPAKTPTALLVYAHGYGYSSLAWAKHMSNAAERGAIAITMDYRGLRHLGDSNGDGIPESRGFPVITGAEDSIAAGQMMLAMCPSAASRTVIFGTSLGGNIAGMVVATMPRRADGNPLFDYWFQLEGLSNLTEEYLGARALAGVNAYAKQAVEDMEAETGGPIERRPEEYRRRTVVAHEKEIGASGLKGAVVVHGLDDGLVPYDQGVQTTSLLVRQKIPVEFYTITRRSPESEKDKTLTSYAVEPVQPNYVSPLPGHAWEASTTHIINRVGFNRLWELLAGELLGCFRNYIVDAHEKHMPIYTRTDAPCSQ